MQESQLSLLGILEGTQAWNEYIKVQIKVHSSQIKKVQGD